MFNKKYLKKNLHRLGRSGRLHVRRSYSWWHAQDKRYRWVWRIGNGLAAVLILASVALPVVSQLNLQNQYKLSAAALSLVGNTDTTLAKQLTYDASTQTYQFNKDAIKSSGSNPLANLKSQVGTASGGKDKSLYALDVPQDLRKGVTYHDINSQLDFSLKPEFKSSNGQTVDGHLVYPLGGGTQAIYTLKNNGLKEDIVVPQASSDTMRFSYQLDLPKTLQAKVIPDGGGAIGIYSADPSLFGDISYGSDADQAAVEKARENGDKTYLMFGLPAPIIKAPDGASVGNASARFELNGNQLTVVAENLSSVKTPITIDPSVVVTSTTDFQTGGNNEGNIDFGTANQVSRGGLTGGSLSGGWTADSHAMTQVREGAGEAVYNGRLYIYGGSRSGNDWSDLEYTTLNSDGSLGGWTYDTTNVFTTARAWFGGGLYDGYLYVIGGYDISGNTLSDVQYAQINPTTGDIGAWTTNTVNLPGGRGGPTANFQNGYVYVIGGADATQVYNTVQYAPIHGDGSIGSWTTSTNQFTTGRQVHSSAIYNGNLYVLGGENFATTTEYNDVQYAHINADGSIGSFTATTSFNTARWGQGTVAYGGYLYIFGGNDTANDRFSDTQYAPINANGSIGSWANTASLINSSGAASRWNMASAAYNGYIYLVGGSEAPPGNVQNDTIYAKIDPAGQASTYTTSAHTFTTPRIGSQSVAYNGWLYVMGGASTVTNPPVNTISAAPLSANGTVGTFTSTGMTAFPTGRSYFAAVADNGYIYVLGGCNSAIGSCTTATNDLATVYSAPINPDGTIGSWTGQTSFVTARYGLSAAIYDGFIYVLDGVNATTFQNDIQYHSITAGGTISGAWTLSTKTISTARAYSGVGIYGGNLYIVGGCTAGATSCTSYQNDIQYAQLASNGDLSASPTTNSTTFTNARGYLGMVFINGYMYIVGGRGASIYGDTQYAPINSSGSVGTWTTSTGSTLSTARYGSSSATYNGYIYVDGGFDTISNNDVQYALANNGGTGSTGTWADDTSAGWTARYWNGSVAYNGYLYVIGGATTVTTSPATGLLNDVEYASLSANGSVGSWNATTSLSSVLGGAGLYGMGVAAYNGYLYVVDGSTGSGDGTGITYYAPIAANGTVGSWTASGPMVSTQFGHHSDGVGVVAYNGYIYELGGNWCSNNCRDTQAQFAAINANGSLGTWTSTNGMTYARRDFGVAVYSGRVYAFGGTDDGTHDYSPAEYATLNSNGTIGTWTATTSIDAGDIIGGAVNGFVYAVGNESSYAYAAINANGSLGNWQWTPGPASINRGSPGGDIYNGYIYMVAGVNAAGTAGTNDVQYAPLSSMPRIATYSKLIDLGGAVNVTGITYDPTSKLPMNSLLPGVTPITYRAAGSNGAFGASNFASGASGSGGCTGNVTNTRYLLVTVILDDSTMGTFPDAAGTAANLTAFTINYNPVHPPPNIRLRAGQTLQTGNLSALDTCTP